jgi:hypothetical protein
MIQHTISKVTREVTQAQIWCLMSNVDQWSSWDTTIESAFLKGEFKTDSQFTLRPKGGPTVKIKLVEVEPAKYFKDETNFPLAKMHGEHWYENTPEGLKITVRMTMSGMLAPLWNKIVMKNIVDHLAEDIDNQISSAKNL